MSINIVKILTESQIKLFDNESINKINEVINNEFNKKISQIESTTNSKFDSMVNEITEKFENKVSKIIVENVNDNISTGVNKKLFNIVRDIAGVLEAADIPATEESKKLKKQIEKLTSELNEKKEELQSTIELYKDAEKERYILDKLSGMKPEIVSYALSVFKDKDMNDVIDGLPSFLDGDFTDLLDTDSMTINEQDIVDGIDEYLGEIGEKVKSKFESIKGLSKQKAYIGSHNEISAKSLIESELISSSYGEVDDDTKDVLMKMGELSNIGYKFKK